MIRVLLLAQTVASTARGAGTPGGGGRDVSGLVGAAASAVGSPLAGLLTIFSWGRGGGVNGSFTWT